MGSDVNHEYSIGKSSLSILKDLLILQIYS